jgi:diguanylate cyclase (GGDEF)-like protein
MLFALLTPLWIVVDILVLPYPLSLYLAILRLAATAAFCALVLWRPEKGRQGGKLRSAYVGLAALFAIPTLFYVQSHMLLAHHHLEGISSAISTGYAFLPFVLLAGFAVFPLTLLEGIAFGLPVLFAHGLAVALNWSEVHWPSFAGQFWLLFLLTGVACLASLSQLAFIIALVGQSIHDPLTGAFSRRSGEEMLEVLLSYARRNHSALSLAFVDIDHFKSVNDQHGHEAGDQVLQQLGRALSGRLRSGDILVRWGGEEFLLIMPNTDCRQARRVLERLLRDGLGLRPDGTPLTASIGLVETLNDCIDDAKTLVERADARMYQAKQQGRARIVAAEPEPSLVCP